MLLQLTVRQPCTRGNEWSTSEASTRHTIGRTARRRISAPDALPFTSPRTIHEQLSQCLVIVNSPQEPVLEPAGLGAPGGAHLDRECNVNAAKCPRCNMSNTNSSSQCAFCPRVCILQAWEDWGENVWTHHRAAGSIVDSFCRQPVVPHRWILSCMRRSGRNGRSASGASTRRARRRKPLPPQWPASSSGCCSRCLFCIFFHTHPAPRIYAPVVQHRATGRQ